MKAFVCLITKVDEPAEAETLTVLTVHTPENTHQVVANKDNGVPRWEAGEICVYIPEGAIVPQDVLEDRGYWIPGEKKGLLAASKGNRVKGRAFAKSEAKPEGFASEGLVFKVEKDTEGKLSVTRREREPLAVEISDDVAEYLGLEEFAG